MELRTDAVSRRRDQHLSRAAWLQCRWQEVCERERRAQLHNRKLLQDFQRAQNILSDLVARTEAMNTIRVEYERYLEENFPRWQQKLKDKRLSEQRKRIEAHLKACIQQMEEDQRIDRANKSPIRTNSPSRISPDLSHSFQRTSDHKEKTEVNVQMPRSTLSHTNNKRNVQRNIQTGSHPLHIPFTGLTQSQPSVTELQRSNISKKAKTFQNIHQALNSTLLLPDDPFQDTHTIVQQEPPSTELLRQYSKPWAGRVQHEPAGAPWANPPAVNPLVLAMMGMSEADAERMQCREATEEEKWRKDSSSTQVEKHQVQKQKRKVKNFEQSSKTGTKAVHLSNDHEDSSERSALSCEAMTNLAFGMQRRRKKRTEEKEAVCQGSFSMSDSHSDTFYKNDKINHGSTTRKNILTSEVSDAKVKSTARVDSTKHLQEEAKSIQETLTGSSSTVKEKKKKKKGYYKKHDTEKNDHKVQEERVGQEDEAWLRDDGKSKEGQKKKQAKVGDEKQEEEVGNNGLCRRRNGRSARDEEKADERMEQEPLRSSASEEGSFSEKEVDWVDERETDNGEEEEDEDEGEKAEEDGGKEVEEDGEEEAEAQVVVVEDSDRGEEAVEDTEEEAEEYGGIEEDKDGEEEEDEDRGEEEEEYGDEEEEEEGEKEEESENIRVEVRGLRKRNERDDESDEEGNGSEVAASGSSGIIIHDSLKELYKYEETEDEELYNQEIEDDIEDDDDNVVVEKAWSPDPVYNHTKYQDDDDEDEIEGLLAPKDVQQHQTDKQKETVNPKDLQSESEEDDVDGKRLSAPVNEDPVDSDDEFDHFYD